MKKITVSGEITSYDSIDELDQAFKTLFLTAMEAVEKSYAPYSLFNVGAAVLLENGEILSGANQENASYPACICAEQSVLATASSMFPNQSIVALAVTASKNGVFVEEVTPPCGICRQVMKEWQTRMKANLTVLFSGPGQSIYKIDSIDAILPLGFDSTYLL